MSKKKETFDQAEWIIAARRADKCSETAKIMASVMVPTTGHPMSAEELHAMECKLRDRGILPAHGSIPACGR